MKKLKILTGVVWALLCLVLILVLFPGLNVIAGSLSKLPFMKLNPNYSGGEITATIPRHGYAVEVHRPVFDGLTGERKQGFVQVGWRGDLPDIICDTIDFDADGSADFVVSMGRQAGKSGLEALNDRVGKLIASTPTSYGWVVRVGLRRED